jgi:hypothetical protein
MCRKFALGLVAAILVCSSGLAQEVTLRAVTAFAEKTTYSRGFETFIERVNAEGKGTIQINYIGGPKAMPPFEVGNALKSCRVDIANTTGAFTTNVMPESDAWKLTERPMSELRKMAAYDYMAKLYAEDECYFSRATDRQQSVSSLFDQADFNARPDRSEDSHHPGLRDFFQALGATVVQTPPGEVYTSLERLALSTDMAGQSPASSTSAGMRRRSIASIPDSIPSRSRSRQQDDLGQAVRRSESRLAQGGRTRGSRSGGEFAAENAKDTNGRPMSVSNHQFDCGSRSIPGESLPGRLGGRSSSRARTRPDQEFSRRNKSPSLRQVSPNMARLSEVVWHLLETLVFAACLLLLIMTVMIGADVVCNFGGGGVGGEQRTLRRHSLPDDVTRCALAAASGQHIRVDIILRALPVRAACCWNGSATCRLFLFPLFVWYGCLITERATTPARST